MAIFNGTVENIENNKNKVVEINKNSTNEQYPSAKAVYDITNWKLISGETIPETSPSCQFNLGGKYKKLLIFFTFAYDSEVIDKGYIDFYANAHDNEHKFFNFANTVQMPTTSGKFTFVRFSGEVVDGKAFGSLQYMDNIGATSARYAKTNDIATTFFPLDYDYFETLQLDAVNMAFTAGTKIEIYGVKA